MSTDAASADRKKERQMAMTATTLKEISDHIAHMTFRRKLFGGVDERDVWRQIQQLDDDYRNLFRIMNQ